jgi:hypothetical protein
MAATVSVASFSTWGRGARGLRADSSSLHSAARRREAPTFPGQRWPGPSSGGQAVLLLCRSCGDRWRPRSPSGLGSSRPGRMPGTAGLLRQHARAADWDAAPLRYRILHVRPSDPRWPPTTSQCPGQLALGGDIVTAWEPDQRAAAGSPASYKPPQRSTKERTGTWNPGHALVSRAAAIPDPGNKNFKQLIRPCISGQRRRQSRY